LNFDFKEFSARLTWVDLVVFVALLRGFYIGIRSGFFAELLRFAAYIVTIGVTYRYYKQVGEFITLNSFLNEMVASALGFAVLAIAVFLLTKIFVALLKKMLKVGEGGLISRLAGAITGVCRWLVILGLVFSFIDLLPISPLKKDIHERSVSGQKIFQIMPTLLDFFASLSPQLSVPKK
jgi:uncharacterized membrane protein required for colicin V production